MELERERTYDHRHWVLEPFFKSRAKNPRYSLRAFAARLGISHSALSEILSGKRPLTRKMAIRLSERLNLTPDQVRLFVRSALVAKMSAAIPDDREILRLQDGTFRELDVEAFKAIADWYHYAILSLFDIPGGRASAAWVARRLGITRHEAQDALKRLKRLGFLEMAGESLRQSSKPLSFYSQGYDLAIRNFLHQIMEKAAHSLDADPAELRELSATVMAIDPAKLPKARDAIRRFRRELADLLESGEQSRVYALSVQLVPLDIADSSRRSEDGEIH